MNPRASQRSDPWIVTEGQSAETIYSYLPEPDPDWKYTDAAGHPHFYGPEGGYPTVTWVLDRRYWCEGCRDEHQEGHWECPLCGEHVVPGTRMPSPYGTMIFGPRTVSLTYDDGRERREYAILTAEDADGLMRDREATIERIARTQQPISFERRY